MKNNTQQKIGKTFDFAERDAIHISVLPAKAHADLEAGEAVGFQNGETYNDNHNGELTIKDKEVEEVTMEEVCEKFGCEVKIKK